MRGLSGIAKDMDELGLEVTYTRSMYDVYEATTRALLLQGNIDMLTWARAGVTRSPSRVPNLALPIRAGWSEDVGRTLFKATASKYQLKVQEPAIITPGSICLQGVVVDTVKDTGSIWEADPDKSFDQNAFLNMVRELVRFLEKSRYDEDHRTDAICRIPVGDKELPEASPYFVRATERSAEQFSALISKTMDSDMMAATYSYQTCMGYTYMARPVFSEQGFVGVGPSNMEAGDVIVLVFEGSTPFVLRPRTDNQGGYLLVGEAYIDGIKDEEFLEDERPVDTFELW